MIKAVLTIVVFLLGVTPSWALISVKSTFSGGHYQDNEKKSHTSIFYNLRFNKLSESGIETFIELDLNNSFVMDKWDIYPYQLSMTIPFDNGFEEAPFNNSRIQIGRQLLTEGFEMDIIDGVTLPYYINKDFGFNLFGGGVYIPDETEGNFVDQIYGGNLFLKKWETLLKVGPTIKKRHSEIDYYGTMSLYKSWYKLPFSPSVLIKEQWNAETNTNDQRLSELHLNFGDLYTNFRYSERKPDRLLQAQRNYVYSLFSTDKTKGFATVLTWDPGGQFQISSKFEFLTYPTIRTDEKSNIQEVSLFWTNKEVELTPSVTRLNSYGGDIVNFGLLYKINLSKSTDFKAEGNMAKFKKINKIEGWAYHFRSGFNFKLMNRLSALISGEIERNHLFDFDTRAAFYVTHYYY